MRVNEINKNGLEYRCGNDDSFLHFMVNKVNFEFIVSKMMK